MFGFGGRVAAMVRNDSEWEVVVGVYNVNVLIQ